MAGQSKQRAVPGWILSYMNKDLEVYDSFFIFENKSMILNE